MENKYRIIASNDYLVKTLLLKPISGYQCRLIEFKIGSSESELNNGFAEILVDNVFDEIDNKYHERRYLLRKDDIELIK